MHPLDSPFLKLRRANTHLNTLNDLIEGFLKRDPYKIVHRIVINGNTRECQILFDEREKVDPEIPLIIGDICNNLRSALDHLLWQLWLLKKSSFNSTVYFPICDSVGAFNNKTIQDNIKGLTDVQKTAIEHLQPYNAGNSSLSLLREVNRTDKHRLIHFIGFMGQVDNIRLDIDQSSARFVLPQPPIKHIRVAHGSVKIVDKAIVARIPLPFYSKGTKINVHSRCRFYLVFEGSGKADRQRLDDSLHSMIAETNRIVDFFEPEFSSFGTSIYK